MKIDASAYSKIKAVVLEALEAPADLRADIIERLCEGDSVMRAHVMSLLNQDVGTVFLSDSPVELLIDSKLEESKPEQDLIGKIGRISITKLIARGGMGEVYEGVDDLLGRKVALKVIRRQSKISPERKQAFLNEAQILSNLAHPNICQVYDFFDDQERDVLVMELIHGQTLSEALAARNDASSIQPLDVLNQITAGLVEAHERGVVHYDLKPDNIMLTASNQVKILDFGLANKRNHEGSLGLTAEKPLLAGTLAYMSPEQAKGEPASSSSDMWSLGLIFIELFSGDISKGSASDFTKLLKESQVRTPEIPSSIRGDKRALVQDLLSVDPSLRPTAREALTRLKRIREQPKRRLIMFASICAGLLMAFSILKYFYDLNTERELAQAAEQKASQARDKAEGLIAFMLSDLHDGLQSVGRLELMESTTRKALDYYGELDSDTMQESQGQATVAMRQIALVLDKQGDKSAAIQIAEKALSSLQSLSESSPDDEVVLARLGWMHYYLSEVYLLTGEIEKSLSNSTDTIRIGRKLTASLEPGLGPKGEPTPVERWRVLFQGLYRQADALMRSARPLQAVALLDEAALLATPGAQVEPKLAIYLGNILYKRCDNYNEIGSKTSLVPACLAMYEQDKTLYEQDPENHSLRVNFAADHISLVRAYTFVERYQDAIATAHLGDRHFNALLEWDAANKRVVNDYVDFLIRWGEALTLSGQGGEAKALYSKADKLLKPLLDGEEATHLNNQFSIALYFGRIEEARSVAKALIAKKFTRRGFIEKCDPELIAECEQVAPAKSQINDRG